MRKVVIPVSIITLYLAGLLIYCVYHLDSPQEQWENEFNVSTAR